MDAQESPTTRYGRLKSMVNGQRQRILPSHTTGLNLTGDSGGTPKTQADLEATPRAARPKRIEQGRTAATKRTGGTTMEGTMRTTAKHDESYAPRKLTQDERLMVACVIVALLACLGVAWVCFNPAVDAGALAGV